MVLHSTCIGLGQIPPLGNPSLDLIKSAWRAMPLLLVSPGHEQSEPASSRYFSCSDAVVEQTSAFILNFTSFLCMAADEYARLTGEGRPDVIPTSLRPAHLLADEDRNQLRREPTDVNEDLWRPIPDRTVVDMDMWSPREESQPSGFLPFAGYEPFRRSSTHLRPELSRSMTTASSLYRPLSSPPATGWWEAESYYAPVQSPGLTRSHSHVPSSSERRPRANTIWSPSGQTDRPWEYYETPAPAATPGFARRPEVFEDDTDFHLFVAATAGLPSPTLQHDSEVSPVRLAHTFPMHQHATQAPPASESVSSRSLALALQTFLNDPGTDFAPSDDELPDYEQSQAEATERRRASAARRAAELEARWAQARRNH